mmetsp:Transcript_20569/g.48316  ORF Transcript_20569/g.48316 Transcript_20569/m.48316 type:complete len:362 (+) Transcript_20569:563-1648(+)
MPAFLEDERHDLVASLSVRQVDFEHSREPPQDGIVDVPRSIGGPQHHDRSVGLVAVPGRGDSVPEGQEFGLDGVPGAVFRSVPGVQKGVQLVYKDDGRGQLVGEAENGVDEFVGFPEPLAHDLGELDGQERRLGFLGNGLGQHGFSRPGRSVQQDAPRSLQQSRLGKEFWLLEGQDRQFPDFLFLVVQSPNVGKPDGNVRRIDHVLGNLSLVRSEGRNLSPLLLHEFVESFLGGRGGGLGIGVHVSRLEVLDDLVDHERGQGSGGNEHAELDGEFHQELCCVLVGLFVRPAASGSRAATATAAAAAAIGSAARRERARQGRHGRIDTAAGARIDTVSEEGGPPDRNGRRGRRRRKGIPVQD